MLQEYGRVQRLASKDNSASVTNVTVATSVQLASVYNLCVNSEIFETYCKNAELTALCNFHCLFSRP